MKLRGMLSGLMLCAFVARPLSAQLLSRDEMLSYGVQSICVDDAGRPTKALPIEDGCVRSRLQDSKDIATYRKHDWPNSLNDPAIVLGYQASDSVIQRRGGRTLVVQTFDFGTEGREFGRFDRGRGDGGQVMLLVGDWASFPMTEDGGGGVQWFVGEGCRTSRAPDAAFTSWLVYRNDAQARDWGSAVIGLNIMAVATICPRRFGEAYTRYRLDQFEFPFRIISDGPVAVNLRHRLNVVVSEHYGGRDVPSADHLERFFLAKGLGLVRWERWANGNLAQPPAVQEAERALAQTARCPELNSYAAPDRNWLLVDCRTWTTLVPQRRAWSVDNYNWSAIGGFGRVE